MTINSIQTPCRASHLMFAANSAAGVAPNIGGSFHPGLSRFPRRPVGGFIPQPSEYPTARRFGGLS